MPGKRRFGSVLDDGIKAELTRLLFATPIPQAIIGFSTAAFALILHARTGGAAFPWIILLTVVITFHRVSVVFAFRRWDTRIDASVWALLVGGGYIAFALVLALFSIETFRVADVIGQFMAAILVVAFCAGAVTRTSVRPWIATASILTSASPLMIGALAQLTLDYVAIGVVLFALALGSLDSVRHNYLITVEHLTTRRRFAELATYDDLTELPNRAMLTSHLDDVLSGPRCKVAVHCVDLDHFKPVNDLFGHAAGDLVLTNVAQRLRTLMRDGSFVARLGGDEFVIVQRVTHSEEANSMGEAIVEALNQPILLPEGNIVAVGASSGCCVVEAGTVTRAEAMAAADAALYAAKQDGRGRSILRGYSRSR